MSHDNRITVDFLLEENKLLRLQIKYLIDIIIKFSGGISIEKETDFTEKD